MQRTIAIAAALLAALAAHADVRLSPGDGTNHSYPTVCRQPDGFVAAWERDGDDGREVTVQRLDDDGRPRDFSWRANQENAGDQQLPDIACRDDGSFLLVWESRDQDGDGLGIFARDFAADGTPNGDEFQVNTYTADHQRRPRVCAGSDGSALVVWDSAGQDGDGSGVYSRRLDENAAPLAGELRINEAVAGNQTEPAVACDAAGRRLIAWTTQRVEGSDVFARLMEANGELEDLEIRFSSGEAGAAGHAALATLPNESFLFAHEAANADVAVGVAQYQSGVGMGLSMRPLLLDLRNEAPAVATAADGRFLVAWSRGAEFDFDLAGLRRRTLFDSDRTTLLSADRTGNAGAISPLGRGIAIASAPDGDLVVWQRRDVFADDSSSVIFARRFRDCIGDCSGDDVVAINELITGVRIALNEAAVDICSRLDANASGAIEINELIRAVNEALARICPAPTN